MSRTFFPFRQLRDFDLRLVYSGLVTFGSYRLTTECNWCNNARDPSVYYSGTDASNLNNGITQNTFSDK